LMSKKTEVIIIRCTPDLYDRFHQYLRAFKRDRSRGMTSADFLDYLLDAYETEFRARQVARARSY